MPCLSVALVAAVRFNNAYGPKSNMHLMLRIHSCSQCAASPKVGHHFVA
jgi:hypothetical protein